MYTFLKIAEKLKTYKVGSLALEHCKCFDYATLFMSFPANVTSTKSCIGSVYWYKYLSANVNVQTEARGVGGMLPQENFLEFDAVRDGF